MALGSLLNYTFTWKIDIFSLYNFKKGEVLCSSTFVLKTLCRSKWCIRFYPKGVNSAHGDFSSIYLSRGDEKDAMEILTDITIDVFNGNGECLIAAHFKEHLFPAKTSAGFSDFLKSKHIADGIYNWKDKVLTIRCKISSKLTDESIPSGCEAHTKAGVDLCSFEWNFPIPCFDSTEWTKTGTFSFLPASVIIALSFSDLDDKLHIIIRIAEDKSTESKLVCGELSLLDNKGQKVVSKTDFHLFGPDDSTGLWNFPAFITKQLLQDDRNVLLRENSYTLKCEISIPNGTVTTNIENYTFHPYSIVTLKPETNMLSSLQNNLREMFTLKKHCDVNLQVGNSLIPAHKGLLAARSPVFSAMFDQDMLENKTGIIHIQDITADTMISLLESIYTGLITELDYVKASEL